MDENYSYMKIYICFLKKKKVNICCIEINRFFVCSYKVKFIPHASLIFLESYILIFLESYTLFRPHQMIQERPIYNFFSLHF